MAKVECSPGSDACRINDMLLQAGVSDSDIDRGEHVIDYGKPGPNMTLVGQGDGVKTNREIYETALDLCDKNPSNDTYCAIAESFAGKPLLWSLESDPSIRQRVQTMVGVFRTSFAPLHAVFGDELLVRGLYYFVLAPVKLGGLGVDNMGPTGKSYNLSAIDSIQLGIGMCPEASRILRGVLHLAGFQSQFVYARGMDVKPRMERLHQLIPDNIAITRHIYIEVSLPNGRLYLDPALNDENPHDVSFYPEGLLQHLAGYYYNLGVDANLANKPLTEVETFYRKAMEFNPYHPDYVWNLAATFFDEGKFKESIEYLTRSGKLAPTQVVEMSDLPDTMMDNSVRFWLKNPKMASILTDFGHSSDGNFEVAMNCFVFAVSLWNIAEKEEARQSLQRMDKSLAFIGSPTPDLKVFFENILQLMPTDMKQDARIQITQRNILRKLQE